MSFHSSHRHLVHDCSHRSLANLLPQNTPNMSATASPLHSGGNCFSVEIDCHTSLPRRSIDGDGNGSELQSLETPYLACPLRTSFDGDDNEGPENLQV